MYFIISVTAVFAVSGCIATNTQNVQNQLIDSHPDIPLNNDTGTPLISTPSYGSVESRGLFSYENGEFGENMLADINAGFRCEDIVSSVDNDSTVELV